MPKSCFIFSINLFFGSVDINQIRMVGFMKERQTSRELDSSLGATYKLDIIKLSVKRSMVLQIKSLIHNISK